MSKEKEEKHEKHGHQEKTSFYAKVWIPIIAGILFIILFAVIFNANKETALKGFNEANSDALGLKNLGVSADVGEFFESWGMAIGIGIGIVGFLLLLILFGISKAVKLTRFPCTNPILLLLVYGLIFLFGMELSFFEVRYSSIGNGVIFFIGYPLFYASLIVVIGAAVLLAFMLLRKKSGKHE